MNKNLLFVMLTITTTLGIAGIAHASGQSSDTSKLTVHDHVASGTSSDLTTGVSIKLNGVNGPAGIVNGANLNIPGSSVGSIDGVLATQINSIGGGTQLNSVKHWNFTDNTVRGAFPAGLPQAAHLSHAGLLVPGSHLSVGRVKTDTPDTGSSSAFDPPPFSNAVASDNGVYFGLWHRPKGKAAFPNDWDGSEPPAGVTNVILDKADVLFYGGPNNATGYPTGSGASTNVTYKVVGLTHGTTPTSDISSHGNFTANFNTLKLTGSLNAGLNIGTANIHATNGSFSGNTATHSNGNLTGGNVTGQFYKPVSGKAPQDLAGYAKFGAGTLGADTAFGGKKQ